MPYWKGSSHVHVRESRLPPGGKGAAPVIVYHGTTLRRAQRIALEGLLPRKPSRRVWFAESRGYAENRARTQARRAHDRPVVLACEISVPFFRKELGGRRVHHRNRVIAIEGPVPATAVLTRVPLGKPPTPKKLANWVNMMLGLPQRLGVAGNHPGIRRLAQWAERRLQTRPEGRIKQKDLLARARKLLPEFFRGARVDLSRPGAHRPAWAPEGIPKYGPADARETVALAMLEDADAVQRMRGLEILAQIRDPDLFEWCAMFLEDQDIEVRVAALRTMLRCEQLDTEMLVPLVEGENKRVRAAAIAALATRGGAQADRWYERGLKDPEPCVRLETARALRFLDPKGHRRLFEIARRDPNPQIVKLAKKLTAGKGDLHIGAGRQGAGR